MKISISTFDTHVFIQTDNYSIRILEDGSLDIDPFVDGAVDVGKFDSGGISIIPRKPEEDKWPYIRWVEDIE